MDGRSWLLIWILLTLLPTFLFTTARGGERCWKYLWKPAAAGNKAICNWSRRLAVILFASQRSPCPPAVPVAFRLDSDCCLIIDPFPSLSFGEIFSPLTSIDPIVLAGISLQFRLTEVRFSSAPLFDSVLVVISSSIGGWRVMVVEIGSSLLCIFSSKLIDRITNSLSSLRPSYRIFNFLISLLFFSFLRLSELLCFFRLSYSCSSIAENVAFDHLLVVPRSFGVLWLYLC